MTLSAADRHQFIQDLELQRSLKFILRLIQVPWPLFKLCIWSLLRSNQTITLRDFLAARSIRLDGSSSHSFAAETPNLSAESSPQCEVLFLSQNNFRFASAETGTPQDRIFSPLEVHFRHNHLYVTKELARAKTSVSRFKALGPRIFSLPITATLTSRLLRRQQVSTSFITILVLVAKYFIEFYRGCVWSQGMLDQESRLRICFTSSWYDAFTMGAIATFHRHGLHVVDLQHGQQGPFQSMQSGWRLNNVGNPSCVPDEMWVWGQHTKARLQAASSAETSVRIEIVGYPFLGLLREGKAPSFLASPSNAVSAPRVLVSLQYENADNPSTLPSALSTLITRSNAFFGIRPHPTSPETTAVAAFINKLGLDDRVSIEPASEPFAQQVQRFNAHLTGSSSTVLEAAALGIRSFTWSPLSRHLYGDLYEEGIVTEVDLKSHRFSAPEPLSESQVRFVNAYIMTGSEPLQMAIDRISSMSAGGDRN